MVQSCPDGRARAVHPGNGEAREDERGEERQLETGIDQQGRLRKENHKRSDGDGVEQLDAAKKRTAADIESGDERRAENWRAVLHDADVGREDGQTCNARPQDRQPESAAEPENKNSECADMQARHDEHVVGARLLEICHNG